MGNVRYRADWNNLDKTAFRIDIVDVNYDGDPLSLEIGMDSQDGFTLDYSGSNSGRFNGILASEAIINCVVEDGYFETLINDIVNSQEQRFYVIIYRSESSVWKIHWAGLVMQNLINHDDVALPYMFQLHATDGLGRLKDIEYPYTVDAQERFIEYLMNILELTTLTQFWGSTDEFLVTGINWYESSQFAYAPADALDPLYISRVGNNAFLEFDEFGEIKAKSCYDVLEQICNRWYANLVQANGRFWFIQINEMASPSYRTRTYDKTIYLRSYDNAADFRVFTTSFSRTGSYSYLPALRQASVKYSFKQSIKPINMLPVQPEYKIPVSFGTAQGGNGERLLFSGTVRCYLDVGAATFYYIHRWVFDMMIKVGSYYLTNQNGYPEWTTTSTARYEIKSPSWKLPNFTGSYSNYFVIAFETPDIPESGPGTFSFDFVEIQEITGDPLTLPPDSTTVHICQDFTIRQNIDNNVESGTNEFIAINQDAVSTTVDSVTSLKFPDMLTGDGPNAYSDGRIQIFTAGGQWENSNEEWSVGGTGSGVNINSLLVAEAVAGQRRPLKIYNGQLTDNGANIAAFSIIVINAVRYILRQATYNANFNTWQGTWVEIDIDRNDIVIDENTTYEDGNNNILMGIGGSVDGVQTELRDFVNNPKVTGNGTLLTSSYIIKPGEAIFYCNPGIGGMILTLPNYDQSRYFSIKIINASASNTLTIGREKVGDLINASASDYTLAADSSVEVHNTGISTIGWATIFNSTRK